MTNFRGGPRFWVPPPQKSTLFWPFLTPKNPDFGGFSQIRVPRSLISGGNPKNGQKWSKKGVFPIFLKLKMTKKPPFLAIFWGFWRKSCTWSTPPFFFPNKIKINFQIFPIFTPFFGGFLGVLFLGGGYLDPGRPPKMAKNGHFWGFFGGPDPQKTPKIDPRFRFLPLFLPL